jgi:hypothetical protein
LPVVCFSRPSINDFSMPGTIDESRAADLLFESAVRAHGTPDLGFAGGRFESAEAAANFGAC